MTEQKPNIGIVVAMTQEAEILADALNLHRRESTGPFTFYQSQDNSVVMVTPGVHQDFQSLGSPVSMVGKVPSALATKALLELKPQILVNCGTAGGMEGTQVGDIIVGTGVTQHDVHIPLPGYDAYGARTIDLNDAATKPLFVHRRRGLMYGVVSTGESFTTNPAEMTSLTESSALAKDMEGFAVAETAQIFGYSGVVLMLKAITDIVDRGNPEDFEQNFKLAMTNLANAMAYIIAYRNEIS